MEHYRPKMGNVKGGYYQGYYCGRCGAPGLSMMGRCTKGTIGMDHSGVCIANPTLVEKLNKANTPEAEGKRVFKRKLKHGEPKKRDVWGRYV